MAEKRERSRSGQRAGRDEDDGERDVRAAAGAAEGAGDEVGEVDDELDEDAGEDGGEVDDGESAWRRGAARAREGARAARDRIEGAWSSARDTVSDLSDRTVAELATGVRRAVRRHPGTAIVVTLAVGFVIGSLVTRRRD